MATYWGISLTQVVSFREEYISYILFNEFFLNFVHLGISYFPFSFKEGSWWRPVLCCALLCGRNTFTAHLFCLYSLIRSCLLIFRGLLIGDELSSSPKGKICFAVLYWLHYFDVTGQQSIRFLSGVKWSLWMTGMICIKF